MCPIMSFWATLIFHKPDLMDFIPSWLTTVAKNFPMAFFWQIMFCGPLVRWDLQERTGSGSQPLLKPRSQIRMRAACSSAGSNSSFFLPCGQCLYGLRTEQVKIIFLDFQSNEHDPVHKKKKEKTC